MKLVLVVVVVVAIGAIVASGRSEAMTCYPGQHVDDTGVCVDADDSADQDSDI